MFLCKLFYLMLASDSPTYLLSTSERQVQLHVLQGSLYMKVNEINLSGLPAMQVHTLKKKKMIVVHSTITK